MSFEGYQQNICQNGHLFETGLDYGTDDLGNPPKCPVDGCNGRCVWWNIVDTTNGSFDVDADGNQISIDGYVEPELDKSPEYCVCERCNHRHQTKAPTYRIPPEGVGHRVREGGF